MSTGRKILSDFFQEEHTVFIQFFKAFFFKYTGRAGKIGQFFQVVIHFYSSHLQRKVIINTGFCALVG